MKTDIRIESDDRKPKYTALGYRSVRTAPRDGRTSSQIGVSGERHDRYAFRSIVQQSREFDRDHDIYPGMIDRAVSYIVGDGWTLQATDKKPNGEMDTAYNDAIEALWAEEWKLPELRGQLSGVECEELNCRELFLCGDHGTILLGEDFDGKIQLVESEQIVGRKGILSPGLTFDKYGRLLHAYAAPYTSSGYVDYNKAEKYRVGQEFLFLANLRRSSSIRGQVPCQAAFPMLHRIGDVLDSEAYAWQQMSRILMKWLRPRGPQIAAVTSRDAEDPSMFKITDLDMGTIIHGQPGDTIEPMPRVIPGAQFPPAITVFLRLAGLPLGMPLEIVLLDWTKSNYSQSRAVLRQAFNNFRRWQTKLLNAWYEPLFAWKLARWIRAGLIEDRKRPLSHHWNKPSFPWLNELEEAEAYGKQLDRTMITLSEVTRSRNHDLDEIRRQRKSEIIAAINIAKEIETETGVRPDWRPLAGYATDPKAGPATTTPKPEPDAPDSNDDDAAGAVAKPE